MFHSFFKIRPTVLLTSSHLPVPMYFSSVQLCLFTQERREMMHSERSRNCLPGRDALPFLPFYSFACMQVCVAHWMVSCDFNLSVGNAVPAEFQTAIGLFIAAVSFPHSLKFLRRLIYPSNMFLSNSESYLHWESIDFVGADSCPCRQVMA